MCSVTHQVENNGEEEDYIQKMTNSWNKFFRSVDDCCPKIM